jgi:hypothetical protein
MNTDPQFVFYTEDAFNDTAIWHMSDVPENGNPINADGVEMLLFGLRLNDHNSNIVVAGDMFGDEAELLLGFSDECRGGYVRLTVTKKGVTIGHAREDEEEETKIEIDLTRRSQPPVLPEPPAPSPG